jgi:type II secretory pathway pseudopilin PulG
MKKNGFTLVELLIVMTILIIMVVITIGILNAIGLTNKGRDARRKKDLNRMKIALEEYYNDKGQFPQDVTTWNIKSNCGKNVSELSTLNSLPCDPYGEPYKIFVEENKFRIITNLENKKDKDIPTGWYIRNDFSLPALGLNTDNANYGVSSSNILWYEGLVRDYSGCYTNTCFDGNDGCKDYSPGGCIGTCYYQSTMIGGCDENCRVGCCGNGCK